VNLQVQSTNVELEVDDGTGKIGVRMWLDVEDERDPSRRWEYVHRKELFHLGLDTLAGLSLTTLVVLLLSLVQCWLVRASHR
jgi:hypothetical protein